MSGRKDLTAEESRRVLDGIERLCATTGGNVAAAARKLGMSRTALFYLRQGVNHPSLDTAKMVARLEQRPLQEYVDEYRVDDMDPRWPSKGRAVVALRALKTPEHAIALLLEEDPDGVDDDVEYWFQRGLALARLPSGLPNPTVVAALPDRSQVHSSRPPPDKPRTRRSARRRRK